MACSINLRTYLLTNADAGGTWTYNGAILISGSANPFDGNVDNTTQFSTSVDVIASPPEELPASGNPVVGGDNPSLDATGHTQAYYSLTYTLTSGTCSVSNNVVLPIIEGPYAGVNITYPTQCTTPTHTIDLYELVSEGNTNGATASGTWTMTKGFPNPHPGFNSTAGTFDLSTIVWPPKTPDYEFTYTVHANVPNGFTFPRVVCTNCNSDTSTVSLTVLSSGTCCDDTTSCYVTIIPDGTTIWAFTLDTGSTINSSDPNWTPSFTLPGDNADLVAALNVWLAHNGGGIASITAAAGNNFLKISNPCTKLSTICENEGCAGTTYVVSPTTC